MFPLDSVRFWTDLAISHQIWWYFRQNLTGSGEISMDLREILPKSGFLCRICVFFTDFSPCSQIYDSDRPARHPLVVWTVWPDYSSGSAVDVFFSHPIPAGQFQVGHKPDPWIALILVTLLNTLQHYYPFYSHSLTLHIKKHVYLTTPISIYLNTFSYSSLTKSLPLESNLYNFSTIIISHFYFL